MRILLKLQSGFGLGDHLSFGIVLRHLAKYRPEWEISVQAQRGAHSALNGLCHSVFWEDEDESIYDRVIPLSWSDPNVCYHHRPSTKPSYFLPLNFGIQYDPRLGQYQLKFSEAARAKAYQYVSENVTAPFVMIHRQGLSEGPKKNLTFGEGGLLAAKIIEHGLSAITLDLSSPSVPGLILGRNPALWGHSEPGIGDAEVLAAVMSYARGFIGIDSGPAKVAAATGIPCLVIWLRHHPVQHFDPMPNVLHVVPKDHVLLLPSGGIAAEGDRMGAARFFEMNYNWSGYREWKDIPGIVSDWLASQRLIRGTV